MIAALFPGSAEIAIVCLAAGLTAGYVSGHQRTRPRRGILLLMAGLLVSISMTICCLASI